MRWQPAGGGLQAQHLSQRGGLLPEQPRQPAVHEQQLHGQHGQCVLRSLAAAEHRQCQRHGQHLQQVRPLQLPCKHIAASSAVLQMRSSQCCGSLPSAAVGLWARALGHLCIATPPQAV